MSRIGKLIIKLPKGVSLDIKGKKVTAKGPKGELSLDLPDVITIENNEGSVELKRNDELKKSRAFHGLFRALVNNMVIGVSVGFMKELILEGVGWKMEVKKNYLIMNLGYSHPIYLGIPDGITMEATNPISNKSGLKISGISKEIVGLMAAKVRSFRKPEPYKGKGFRYIDEVIIRKAGKTAKA
ncbi:MAG: 50S ribosomal protein L6 [Candidatus Delongbacteria bacterium]|nr:50S ribosomal protein L6 [Candidatus Delongbacteria bacterium]